MNAVKWTQLVCTILLAIAPFGIEYRNWKHNDRRTNRFHHITTVVICMWLLAVGGAAWAMYKDLSKVEKAPQYKVFLNNLCIKDGDYITYYSTNHSGTLSLSIYNHGTMAADGVTLTLNTPRPMIPVKYEDWHKIGGFDAMSPTLKIGEDNALFVEATHLIGVEQLLYFEPITFQCPSNELSSLNGVTLRINSRNGDPLKVKFWVHITNGVANPHLGY